MSNRDDTIITDKSETNSHDLSQQKKNPTSMIMIGLASGLLVIVAMTILFMKIVIRRKEDEQFLADCNESIVDDEFVSINLNEIIHSPTKNNDFVNEDEQYVGRRKIEEQEQNFDSSPINDEENSHYENSTIQTEETSPRGENRGFFSGQVDWLHKTLIQNISSSTSIFDFFEDKPIPEQITIKSPEIHHNHSHHDEEQCSM